MWERLRSIWTIPDLRKKILFTLAMLLVFRVLAHITVPLTHTEQLSLAHLFSTNGNQNLSQLLMPIIPALENMNREGEAGRLRFSQITRIVTVPLAFLQALGNTAIFVRYNVLTNFSLFDPKYALESWAIVLSLVAGTMTLVWIGELVTENGIGNGISIIIFGGIVSRIPNLVSQGVTASSTIGIVSIAVFLLIGLVTILAIVYVYQGQRRVPIEYPTKRMVGRGMLVGTAQRT